MLVDFAVVFVVVVVFVLAQIRFRQANKSLANTPWGYCFCCCCCTFIVDVVLIVKSCLFWFYLLLLIPL